MRFRRQDATPPRPRARAILAVAYAGPSIRPPRRRKKGVKEYHTLAVNNCSARRSTTVWPPCYGRLMGPHSHRGGFVPRHTCSLPQHSRGRSNHLSTGAKIADISIAALCVELHMSGRCSVYVSYVRRHSQAIIQMHSWCMCMVWSFWLDTTCGTTGNV